MTFDESRERFRKSYAAGRDAYQSVQEDRRAHIAMVVIIVLGAVLFELLEHYTTWSSIARIVFGISGFAIKFFQINPVR